jgi:Holliday junction resolvase RusA-like endonuclease
MNCLIDSPSVSKYKKEHIHQWNDVEQIEWFRSLADKLEKPILVGFHFIRDSKRRYDFINALQLPLDIMTKCSYIDDDNIWEIIPVPMMINGTFTTVDKENAGVLFKILNIT